eukprot:Skav230350  [mRNA]  locus=scaffold1251:48840:50231:- [translate_table: standard]
MGVHLPVALEGALKLKASREVQSSRATARERGEVQMRPVHPCVEEISYIHAEGFPASEIRREVGKTVWHKGAALVVLTDDGNPDFKDVAHFTLYCPVTKLEMQSYHIADMRGCSIDQPRNLAKSVTVE